MRKQIKDNPQITQISQIYSQIIKENIRSHAMLGNDNYILICENNLRESV
jgi:uncharacterized protein YneF (UPF0154 family)